MGDNVNLADLYADARYTAEISNRMQVPDRIMVSGNSSPTHSSLSENGITSSNERYNDLGMRQRDPRIDMQVPDRILVAGGDHHVAAKSTPREMQMDNAVMPPTLDHVRVSTPPRSIRLGEHAFPSATDADDSNSTSTIEDGNMSRFSDHSRSRLYEEASTRTNRTMISSGGSDLSDPQLKDAQSLALLNETGGGSGTVAMAASGGPLSTYEEIQLVRRQLAKMNHRLMAVELENQQQGQREMILTVLVSAYFIGKIIMWVNRSL